MAESTSKLRKQVKALTNVDGSGGVDILADEKTFRSTYDIMSDIADVWGSMSDIDQSALLELLAGKVRSNQVAALLSNFDQAEKALKTSQTAEGTMDKVHRAWMDSVEARKAQFEAAQETLSMTVMPANTMKGLYQTGTSALSLLNTVIGGTGTLGFSAGVFGVANALRAGGGDIAAGLGSMLGLHRDTVNGGWTRGDLGFVTAYNEAFSELGDKTAAFKQATAGTSKTLDSYTMSLYNSTSGLIDARKVTTGFGSAIKSFAKNALVGIGTFAAMELAAYGINQAWNFVNSEILHRGETLGNRAAMAHAEAEQAQQTAEARKEEQQSIQQQIASIEQKGQTGGGLTSAEEAELMSLRSQLRVAQYRQEIAEAQAQAKAAKSVQSKTQSYEWDRSQEQNIGAALYTTMGGADAQHAFMSARQNAQNKINQLFEAGLDSTEEYLQTVADWQELDSYARKSYKFAADYANTPRGQALLKQYSEATPEGLEGRYQSMVENRTSALEGQFSEANKDLAGIQARSETLAQLFDFISNTKNLSPEALGEAYQFASQEYDQLISTITATNGRAAAELGKEADSAFSQLREKNVAAGGALADRLTEMEAGAQGWLSDYFQAGGKVSDSQRAAMTDYINSYLGLREVSQPGRKLDAVRSLLAGTPLAEALMELDKLAAESKLTAESISGLKVDNVENAGQRVSDFFDLLGIGLAQAAEMWNASQAESRKDTEGGGTAPAKVDTYGERKTSVAAVFAAQEAGAKLWASTGYSGGMTLEDYETIAGLDEGAYMDAIQYANGGLFFNKDIFNDIVQKKFTDELKGLQKNVFDAQKKYNDAAQRMVEQLRKKNAGASDFDETALKTANTDLQAAAKEIGGYRAMQAQIQNNMTDYANWLRNKSGAESGDMYDEIGSAAQAIVSGITSGKVGTNMFEAAMRLYTGKEHFDVKNLSQNDMQLLRGMAGVDYEGNAVKGLTENTLFGVRNSLQKLGVLGKDYGVLNPNMTAQEMANVYNAANGTHVNGEFMTSVFMALNDYIQMPGNKYDISALESPAVKAMHEASKEFADVAKQYAEGKATFDDLLAASENLDSATANAMLTSGNAEAAAEAAKNIAEKEKAKQQEEAEQAKEKKQEEYNQSVLDQLSQIAQNTAPQSGESEGSGEGNAPKDEAGGNGTAGKEIDDTIVDLEEEGEIVDIVDDAQAKADKLALQQDKAIGRLGDILSSDDFIDAWSAAGAQEQAKMQDLSEAIGKAIDEGDWTEFNRNFAALNQMIRDVNDAAAKAAADAEQTAREEQAKAEKLAAQQDKAYERMDDLMDNDYLAAWQASSADQQNAMRGYVEAMNEAVKNGDWTEFNRSFAALNQMIRDVNDAAAKAAAEAEQTAREEQTKADKLAAQQDKALGRLENVLGSDDYIDAWSDANQQQRDQMQDLVDAMGDAIEKGNWQEFNRNFAALNQLIGEINTAAEQAKAEAQQQALNAQLAEESDYIKDTLNDTAVEQAETATQGAMGFMADLGTQADVDAAIMQEYVDAANALMDSNADLVNAAGQGSKLGDAYEKLAVATAGDDLNALKANMDEFRGALREAKLAQLETDRATQEEQDRQVAESEAAADAERRKLAEQQQHDRLLAEETPDTKAAVQDQKDQASARKNADDAARAELNRQADDLVSQMAQLAELTSHNADAQATLEKATTDLINATTEGSAYDVIKATQAAKEAMASVSDQAAKELSDALTAGRELQDRTSGFFGDITGTGLQFGELGNALSELEAALISGDDATRIGNAIKNLTPLLDQANEALKGYQAQKAAEEKAESEAQARAKQLEQAKLAGEDTGYSELATEANAGGVPIQMPPTPEETAAELANQLADEAEYIKDTLNDTLEQQQEAVEQTVQSLADNLGTQSDVDAVVAQKLQEQQQAEQAELEDQLALTKKDIDQHTDKAKARAEELADLREAEAEEAREQAAVEAAANAERMAQRATEANALIDANADLLDTALTGQNTALDNAYKALSEAIAGDSFENLNKAMSDFQQAVAEYQADVSQAKQAGEDTGRSELAAEANAGGVPTTLTETQIDDIYNRADEVAQNVKDFTNTNLDGNEALMAAGMELANFVAGLGSEISPQELSQLTDKTQAMLDEAMGVVKEQENAQEAAPTATEQTGAGEQAAAGTGGAGAEQPDTMTSASVEPETPGRKQEVSVDAKNATIEVPTGAIGISSDLRMQGQSALFGLEDSSYAAGMRPTGEALSATEMQAVNNAITSLSKALTGDNATALSDAMNTAQQIMSGNIVTEATVVQSPSAGTGGGGGGAGTVETQVIKTEVETPEVPAPDVSPVQIPVEVEDAEVPQPEAPSVTISVSYGDPGSLSVPTPPAVVIPVSWGDPGPAPGGGGGASFTFSGTMAAASGTEYSAAGKYLVDERGAELIEHVSRGTYELGTNSGARFTKLDAGDIVHTAQETRKILGRGGAKHGSAMGNGGTTITFSASPLNKGQMATPYSNKTATTQATVTIQNGNMSNTTSAWDAEKWKNDSIRKILQDAENQKNKGVSNANKDNADGTGNALLEWIKKHIDWIPTYLSVLKKKTTAFITAADDAIHYISKNKLLDDAISNVAAELEANRAAAIRYQEFLGEMAKKGSLSQETIERVQNGTIDITEYSDEDTVKAIQTFQEYWNKLVACRDALKSLNDQMQALSAQKLEHIVSYFDRIDSLLKDQQKTFESLLEMKKQYGQELKVTDYMDSLKTMEQVLANAQNEEAALIQELQEQLGVDGDLVHAILDGGREVWDTISEHVKKNFNSNIFEITKDQLPETEAKPEAEETEKKSTESKNEVRLEHMKATLIRKEDGSLRMLLDKNNKEYTVTKDVLDTLVQEGYVSRSFIEGGQNKAKTTQSNPQKLVNGTTRNVPQKMVDGQVVVWDNKRQAYVSTAILDKEKSVEGISLDELEKQGAEIPVEPITDEEIIALGEKLGLVMSGGSEEALANFETIKSLLESSWEHPLAIGSDTWYEYMSTLEQLRDSIYSTKTEIGDLKDEMADIPLTNLKTGYNYLETIRKNLEDTNSLLDAQGSNKFPNTFESLISVGMKQIENLQEQNKLIQAQMDSLDPLSEKYQELRSSLNGNLDTIADIRRNQEEWNDEIIDLQIDRLKKQNDTYKEQLKLMQALDELDKARQRRLLVYHEEGGFRYEADEDALEDAQEAANDAIYNNIISGLERSKENSNIYGPLGERLVSGNSIVDSLGNTLVPVTDKLSGLNFEPYYQSIVSGAEQSGLLTSMLNSIDMAKLLEASIGGNVSIDLSNMTLNEVNDVKELGDAIIDQLPNYLMQALYQKGA